MPATTRGDLRKAAMSALGGILLAEKRAAVVAANRNALAQWEYHTQNIEAWIADLERQLDEACDVCKGIEASKYAIQQSGASTVSRIKAMDAANERLKLAQRQVEKLGDQLARAQKVELAEAKLQDARDRVKRLEALRGLHGTQPTAQDLDMQEAAEGQVLAAARSFGLACSLAGLQRPVPIDPLTVHATPVNPKDVKFEKFLEPGNFQKLLEASAYSKLLGKLGADGIRNLLEQVVEEGRVPTKDE